MSLPDSATRLGVHLLRGTVRPSLHLGRTDHNMTTHTTSPGPRWLAPIAVAADTLIEAAVIPSFARSGPVLRSRLFGWQHVPPGALDGQVAVVTGATSGIGAALAEGMARSGMSVHLVGRDRAKLDHTLASLHDAVPGAHLHGELADFGRLDDVRALADRLSDQTDQIDVLANIAGALVHEKQTTSDGLELTFQVHVVAPFLLTNALLPLLSESRKGRVLTMSSGGMYTERLDVDQLLCPSGGFDGTTAYARSKRAQVELNKAWAQRHPVAGVGFHAMHPGWVDTPGLTSGLPGFAQRMRPLLRSAVQGADTALWLSWTDEAPAPGGEFWLDRRRRHTIALPWTRSAPGEVDRLWDAITGLVATP